MTNSRNSSCECATSSVERVLERLLAACHWSAYKFSSCYNVLYFLWLVVEAVGGMPLERRLNVSAYLRVYETHALKEAERC